MLASGWTMRSIATRRSSMRMGPLIDCRWLLSIPPLLLREHRRSHRVCLGIAKVVDIRRFCISLVGGPHRVSLTNGACLISLALLRSILHPLRERIVQLLARWVFFFVHVLAVALHTLGHS